MCGIAGVIDPSGSADLPAIGTAMADQLRHRGPDDEGVWVDRNAGVCLSHRRLAVIDLSAAGHQPMLSSNERYVLVYNGEIYNHHELRTDLASTGEVLRGRSDTEVLIAALASWGVKRTLERLNGMFAFALYDRHERTVLLTRDRLGIKPLYYGWCGGAFVFASELSAIAAFPRFAARVDRVALAEYLRYGYIAAPRSIYEEIHKLPAGCLLRLSADEPATRPTPQVYWDPVEAGARQRPTVIRAAAAEWQERIEATLEDAVRQRLVADVPVGAFLSGGIDSSTIVSLMCRQATARVETFAVSVADEQYDESPYSRKVAEQLGTEHHELTVSQREVLDMVPKLAELCDEPFADSSLIPTHLVAQLARRHVTVSLSGDGGDELFHGYRRYEFVPRFWRYSHRIPVGLRHLTGQVLSSIGESWTRRLLPRNRASVLRWLGAAMKARNVDDLYRRAVSTVSDPERFLLSDPDSEGEAAAERDLQANGLPANANLVDQLSLHDVRTYLVDDILTKVDRATMAVSLEARVPILDHRVVELALAAPAEWKTQNGQQKWALRQLLSRKFPAELFDRPKAGFSIPIGTWLRGELRGWAEDLLDTQRLKREGFFRPAAVRGLWKSHLDGHDDLGTPLWTILMFQNWLESANRHSPAFARTSVP